MTDGKTATPNDFGAGEYTTTQAKIAIIAGVVIGVVCVGYAVWLLLPIVAAECGYFFVFMPIACGTPLC